MSPARAPPTPPPSATCLRGPRPGLEQLTAGRAELRQQVAADQAERERLEGEAAALARRVRALGEELAQKRGALEAFDRVIAQTEGALGQLVENSQSLLAMAQGSAADIQRLLGRGGGGGSGCHRV